MGDGGGRPCATNPAASWGCQARRERTRPRRRPGTRRRAPPAHGRYTTQGRCTTQAGAWRRRSFRGCTRAEVVLTLSAASGCGRKGHVVDRRGVPPRSVSRAARGSKGGCAPTSRLSFLEMASPEQLTVTGISSPYDLAEFAGAGIKTRPNGRR